MANDVITIDSAFDLLSKGLIGQQKYQVGSFREFLQNIWCHSYDNPEYFQAWHVGVIADDIQECVESGLNYVESRNFLWDKIHLFQRKEETKFLSYA